MPANVTHMLITHKALQTLKAKGVTEFAQFAEVLDNSSNKTNYKAYVNLGSIGPDLYYYAQMSSSIKDMLQEGFVQAKGVTPWSYHLHSHRPNEFPLKLVQIVFSDAVKKDGRVELYEVYFVLREGKDFTNKHKKRFLSIVSDADLACPLEQKIFEKARAALSNKRHMVAAVKTHTPGLLTQTKLLTSTRIFKAESDKDLLKA